MGISADERYFLLRRLHSLTGIVPLGGFLLFHFFENASARHGADAFNETVWRISQMPYLYALEIGLLLLPILFHGIFGLILSFNAKPNVLSYPYARNWAYLLQRVSGVLALLFVFYHVSSTRIWALFVKGDAITFADMQSRLTSPFVLAAYIVGIVAATWHFSNGLWSFSITWGIVRDYKVQENFAIVTTVLFFMLCIVGLDVLSAFIMDQGALSLFFMRLLNFIGV